VQLVPRGPPILRSKINVHLSTLSVVPCPWVPLMVMPVRRAVAGCEHVPPGPALTWALMLCITRVTRSRESPRVTRASLERFRNFRDALWIENRTRSKSGLRQSTRNKRLRGLTEAEFRSSSIFDPESLTKIPSPRRNARGRWSDPREFDPATRVTLYSFPVGIRISKYFFI
jgi:hypothetical protein